MSRVQLNKATLLAGAAVGAALLVNVNATGRLAGAEVRSIPNPPTQPVTPLTGQKIRMDLTVKNAGDLAGTWEIESEAVVSAVSAPSMGVPAGTKWFDFYTALGGSQKRLTVTLQPGATAVHSLFSPEIQAIGTRVANYNLTIGQPIDIVVHVFRNGIEVSTWVATETVQIPPGAADLQVIKIDLVAL